MARNERGIWQAAGFGRHLIRDEADYAPFTSNIATFNPVKHGLGDEGCAIGRTRRFIATFARVVFPLDWARARWSRDGEIR